MSEGKEIAKWFTRNDLEARPGGKYIVHHDHVGISAEEEVVRYEPPHVFEHTWGRGEWAGERIDTVRWEVYPHETGTRLVLTYRFQDLQNAPQSLAGWHSWLEMFRAVLDGAPRADNEPPHGEFNEGKFTTKTPGKGVWERNAALVEEYGKRLADTVVGP